MYVRAEFRRTKGRKKDFRKEEGMTDVEQRAREKSGIRAGGRREGDLKNGIVKHSVLISYLTFSLSFLASFTTTRSRTYSPASFQPFPSTRASSATGVKRMSNGDLGEERRFLIFARFSYR